MMLFFMLCCVQVCSSGPAFGAGADKQISEQIVHPAAVELNRSEEGREAEKRLKEQTLRIAREIAAGMVSVPAGCYLMGSDSGMADEKPVHEVCVDGFRMGKYEVTQAQWEAVMGSNPASNKQGGNYPVESVSWNDAQEFIRRLNTATNQNFRLPTEAEWEYACRSGGKKEQYCGGDNLDDLAWYEDNSGGASHPVGTKQANGLGLYDMSGNVWEWCSDWYDENYYRSSPRQNPPGPSSGVSRVDRGGSWFRRSGYEYAAFRRGLNPGNRLGAIGFRLVAPPGQ